MITGISADSPYYIIISKENDSHIKIYTHTIKSIEYTIQPEDTIDSISINYIDGKTEVFTLGQ